MTKRIPETITLLSLWTLVLWACAGSTPADELERMIVRLESNGKNKATIDAFEDRAPEIEPTSATYRHAGLAYFGLENYERSFELAKLALAGNADEETAANLFLVNAKLLRKYEEGDRLASAWIEKRIAGDTLRHASVFYAEWDLFDKALRFSTLGMERLPEDARIAGVHTFNLAATQGKTAASSFAGDWAETHMPNAYFWANVGRGFVEIEAFAEAIPYFTKALALKPSDVEIAVHYLDALRAYGDWDAGLEWGMAWENQYTPNADFHKMMGVLMYMRKDYELANHRFELALKSNSNDATSFINMLVSYIELEAFEKAIRLGENWIEAKPELVTDELRFHLGRAHAQNSELTKAEAYYRSAIELAPEKTSYIGHLFHCLNGQNRHEDVLDYYETWIADFPDYEDTLLLENLEIARNSLKKPSHTATENGNEIIESVLPDEDLSKPRP